MEGVLALNLKAYEESIGKKGIALCKAADEVSRETGVSIIIAPQAPNLAQAVHGTRIPIFAQHVDLVPVGANTGSVTAECIKELGCKGSLINHAEKKIRLNDINVLVSKFKALGLQSMVCTADTLESAAVASFAPTYIAVEPPELIGTGISVSKAKPDVVTSSVEAVNRVSRVPVLCGAGITDGSDVARALELGASGVLLASAFVKAKNPKAVLMGMAKGFK